MKKTYNIDTKGLFKIILANAIVYYLNLPWYFYVLVNGAMIGITWSWKKETTTTYTS